MGTITTGIGLISGIDTASLIDSLITLESQGKFRIQARIAVLQAQQTAMLDINARLLNLRNSVNSFRVESIFRAALSTSSNEDILGASAASATTTGSFKFIVNNLVSNSQKLSQGFASRDSSPLGLTSLGFEFGNGRLAPTVDLEVLNGGNGVSRGTIDITDGDGNTATIDLTDVINLTEVIDRINAATGISVTATTEGDHLVITDNAAGAGALVVANGAGFTTATDLGIAATDGGAGDQDLALDGKIQGININTIGLNTPLTSLNDGKGVLIVDNNPDFQIRTKDLTFIDVDLGRINAPITDSTLLADLNDGAGVKIDDDEEVPDIFISGGSNDPAFDFDIDLTGVTTVGELRNRITQETGGDIELIIEPNGKQFRVIDTTGGGGLVQVKGAGTNGTKTAEDLGILEEVGVLGDIVGTNIVNLANEERVQTIQGVLDRINDHLDNQDGGLPDGRKVTASLAPDGVSILLTDNTGGGSGFRVISTIANATAAFDLGINIANTAGTFYDGTRVISALNSVMVENLNGGTGLNGNTTIDITDRNGNNVNIATLASFTSLSEVIDEINAQATLAGVQITAGLNATGNGLKITDTSGGISNLIIIGDAAASLGVDTTVAGVAADETIGTSLQLQYVAGSTLLKDMNYGKGVGLGGILITDGLGATATINIGSDSVTVFDVVNEINGITGAQGLKVNARINDNGDGILIESTYLPGDQPFIAIKIEAAGGSTAKDLNILGTSDTIDNAIIDGSYEQVVELDVTDTLEDVVQKITDAQIPISATILNTGSSASPFRLSLTSEISGAAGDLMVSTIGADIGLTTLTEGKDAKLFFGADNPAEAFLITSSSNTVKDVIPGLTLDLVKASSEVVTVNVSRDEEKIVETVKSFVTGINDVIGRIDEYDFFNVDSEKRGVLLGNPTTSLVRSQLFRAITTRVEGVSTQFQFLHQIGVTVGSGGQINFDESKFIDAYNNDRQGVENLFLALKSSEDTIITITPGVTITNSNTTTTARGVVAIFSDQLTRFIDPISGLLTRSDQSFSDRIKQFEERIELIDQRLLARRARLQSEFLTMELALARLQGQSGALASLSANLFR